MYVRWRVIAWWRISNKDMRYETDKSLCPLPRCALLFPSVAWFGNFFTHKFHRLLLLPQFQNYSIANDYLDIIEISMEYPSIQLQFQLQLNWHAWNLPIYSSSKRSPTANKAMMPITNFFWEERLINLLLRVLRSPAFLLSLRTSLAPSSSPVKLLLGLESIDAFNRTMATFCCD